MDASVREWWSVEDDPDDAMFLQMAARRAAVGPLRVFPTANEARDSLADPDAPRPAAILLDLNLPGMSGYELATRLRAMPGLTTIRLVAVTGHGSDAHRAKARAAGFDEHLLKPVDADALADIVKG